MALDDDSSNWKWGIFYYNKNDTRVMVPKRSKYLGWTLNFASPWSNVILIEIILAIIFH